jgi:hypothetical protein
VGSIPLPSPTKGVIVSVTVLYLIRPNYGDKGRVEDPQAGKTTPEDPDCKRRFFTK